MDEGNKEEQMYYQIWQKYCKVEEKRDDQEYNERRVLVLIGSSQMVTRCGNIYRGVLDSCAASEPTVFKLASFDYRGCGNSSISLLDSDNAHLDTYVKDVIHFVEFLGWSSFDVVGLSFGGMLALNLAIELSNQKRINKICTCSTPPYLTKESRSLNAIAKNNVNNPITYFRESFSVMDSRFRDNLLYSLLPILVGIAFIILPFLKHPNSQIRDDYWYRARLLQLDARAEHNVYRKLDRITSPILVLGGRYDTGCPPSVVHDLYISMNSPTFMYIFEDDGHAFFLKAKAHKMIGEYISA